MADQHHTTLSDQDLHALAAAAANTLVALCNRLVEVGSGVLLCSLAGEAKGLARAVEICLREEVA